MKINRQTSIHRLIIIAMGMSALLMSGGPVNAQYCEWPDIKAAFTTEVFQAPAPNNLAAREAAFAERNSPSNIARLAQQFFNLIEPGHKARELFNKQQWTAALEAYRDFFVERLRFPPPTWSVGPVELWRFPLLPKLPATQVYRKFYNTPENLMSNIVILSLNTITNLDLVRVNIGNPGRVNWTWSPPAYKFYGYWQSNVVYAPMGYTMGHAEFFNVLLKEYMNTRDPRYLAKWSELLDDRFLNWRQDCDRAGFVPIGWNSTEQYTRGVFPQLAYLARKAPNFEKDLHPATLARELLRVWIDYVPRNIRGPRQSISNRRIGIYGQHLFYMALLCPEFKPAQYCLREFRRLVETFPTVQMMADGSDMEPWLNYNYSTPRWWFPEDWSALRHMSYNYQVPSWATPQWQTEMFAMCERRGTFLVRRLMSNGRYPYPGGRGRQKPTYLFSGEAWESTGKIDHENTLIRNFLFGDGLGEAPSFDSEAFPYYGFYYLRTGWRTNDDLCVFMPSTRPGVNMAWSYNNSITLCAYGQDLLRAGWDTPIMVDGCPQIHNETYLAYPAKVREANRYEAMYGKPESGTAFHKPLKNRWLDSSQFAFCEGTYTGPYASYKPDPEKPWQGTPDKFIEGVTHHRQVILLKQSGLLAVTDRLRAQKPHDYILCWPFVEPIDTKGAEMPGFTTNQVVLNGRDQTIKTGNASSANLSLYHVSPLPLKMEHFNFNYIGCSKLVYGGRFTATGDQVLASALYPRRTIRDDLISFKPLKSADPGVTGWEATLADKTRVLYKGARAQSRLALDQVTALAESLLVTIAPDGERRGIALGCTEFALGRKNVKLSCADFEFALPEGEMSFFSFQPPDIKFTPIYRPLDKVEFEPKADCFIDEVMVSMKSADKDVEIRYTLNGADPDAKSHLYAGPITLKTTTMVKARTFRKGVARIPPTVSDDKVSAVECAVYSKSKPREAVPATGAAPGLACSYYEENPWQLSGYIVDVIPPLKHIAVKELFDISAKGTNGVYAFVYNGYIDIPQDGIYSFHAPREFIFPSTDCGYDLRVFLGRDEWYPATRWHNFGTWSVALKKGKHPFRVVWVDQRQQDVYIAGEGQPPGRPRRGIFDDRTWEGEKPVLEISGPGLEKQPIPAGMLYH